MCNKNPRFFASQSVKQRKIHGFLLPRVSGNEKSTVFCFPECQATKNPRFFASRSVRQQIIRNFLPEYEIDDKQYGEDEKGGIELLELEGTELDNDIAENTETDTVGNAVT